MENNDAQAIIDFAEKHTGFETYALEIPKRQDLAGHIAILPEGKTIASLKSYFDEYRSYPERREGTAQHTSLESFIAHVNRFKDAQSGVFFDDFNQNAPRLIAVYDYHQSTESPEHHARFGKHRAEYAFPVSDEWKAWRDAAARPLTQDAFARLLEDRIEDVINPAMVGEKGKAFADELGVTLAGAQKLVELSRGLKLRVDQTFERSVNLQTGEEALVFSEDHKDEKGKPLSVPGGFCVGIPVFRTGVRYQVPVLLRYRATKQQGVTWTISLYRTDLVWQHATDEACDKVADRTGLHVFRGRPE